MARQIKIIAILLAVAIASTWILYRLNADSSLRDTYSRNAPDYFMEDFTTLTMDENGDPKYKLYAVYMAHYPENDTTEVLKPNMEFYRDGKPPLNIAADKGWLTADNDVVLLNGNVEFVEKNELDQHLIKINTESARILINQNYAETDDLTRIITRRTTITGQGMQANFKENKLTVLKNVHTIIKPK